jgi:ferredoxin
MKPAIDSDLCIGDGVCEDLCPAVFQIGDDGLAHVIDDDPHEELYGCIRDAQDACPVACISVTE